MLAGVGASQAFYLASVFLGAVPATYWGWDASILGMLVGLVLTVGVSAATTQTADERTAKFANLQSAE